jgi:prefoldin subunit 5
MGDPDSRTELIEEVDGVELTKYLEEEGFRFPSIVYEFDSERDEAVTVRVEDAVPADSSVDNVEFHPAYGEDYWSIQDETLLFEYELEPMAGYETLYRVRNADRSQLEGDLESPRTVDVTSQRSASTEPEPITRSATDSPYTPTDQPAAGDHEVDSEVESVAVEVQDAIAETGAGPHMTPVDADGGRPDSSGTGTATETLIDRLAAEIEAGHADEESLETLEAALDRTTQSRGSVDARLQQVQSDISDLRAYITALESFLDEHGGGRAVIEEFESRQDEFDADLDALDSSLSELTDELRGVRSAVSGVDDGLETVSTDLEALSERVDTIEADIEGLDEQLPADAIDERFAELEDDLERIGDFVDSLQSAFD